MFCNQKYVSRLRVSTSNFKAADLSYGVNTLSSKLTAMMKSKIRCKQSAKFLMSCVYYNSEFRCPVVMLPCSRCRVYDCRFCNILTSIAAGNQIPPELVRLKLSLKNWVKSWQTYQFSGSQYECHVCAYVPKTLLKFPATRLYFPSQGSAHFPNITSSRYVLLWVNSGVIILLNPHTHLNYPITWAASTCNDQRVAAGQLNHKK